MADGAAELDSMTLGDWIDRNTRTRQARDLIALSCKTVWGAEPSELSLLWALSYMAAGGGFEKLLDVEGGAQQDRVVGGSALIAERMAAALGDRVRLRAPVTGCRLERRRGRGRLRGTCGEGRSGGAGPAPGAPGRRRVRALPARFARRARERMAGRQPDQGDRPLRRAVLAQRTVSAARASEPPAR